MRQSFYYEIIAPFYDTLVPRDIKGICNSVERILKRYNNKKEILDLGCGTGRFTIELAKRGYKMQGFDICDEMLKVARKNSKKRHLKIKFIKADIRNFKLKRKANVIWARGSLGDLLKMADFKKALKNIRNNLLKNGVFIFDVRDYLYHLKTFKKGRSQSTRVFKKRNKVLTFSVVQSLNQKMRIAVIKTEVTVKSPKNIIRFKINHALKHYTKEELAKLLNKAGFKILEIMPGYELAKENKPRILVVVQHVSQ
jgi:ubiquinone/menaquinone biosynthesis C-methylase UbiE